MHFKLGDLVKIGKEIGEFLHFIDEPAGHVTVKVGGKVIAIDGQEVQPHDENAPEAAPKPEADVKTPSPTKTAEKAIENAVVQAAEQAVEQAVEKAL